MKTLTFGEQNALLNGLLMMLQLSRNNDWDGITKKFYGIINTHKNITPLSVLACFENNCHEPKRDESHKLLGWLVAKAQDYDENTNSDEPTPCLGQDIDHGH